MSTSDYFIKRAELVVQKDGLIASALKAKLPHIEHDYDEKKAATQSAIGQTITIQPTITPVPQDFFSTSQRQTMEFEIPYIPEATVKSHKGWKLAVTLYESGNVYGVVPTPMEYWWDSQNGFEWWSGTTKVCDGFDFTQSWLTPFTELSETSYERYCHTIGHPPSNDPAASMAAGYGIAAGKQRTYEMYLPTILPPSYNLGQHQEEKLRVKITANQLGIVAGQIPGAGSTNNIPNIGTLKLKEMKIIMDCEVHHKDTVEHYKKGMAFGHKWVNHEWVINLASATVPIPSVGPSPRIELPLLKDKDIQMLLLVFRDPGRTLQASNNTPMKNYRPSNEGKFRVVNQQNTIVLNTEDTSIGDMRNFQLNDDFEDTEFSESFNGLYIPLCPNSDVMRHLAGHEYEGKVRWAGTEAIVVTDVGDIVGQTSNNVINNVYPDYITFEPRTFVQHPNGRIERIEVQVPILKSNG